MLHDARGEPRTRYGYTQNLEEKYILQHARGTRFLDIGAYDGETMSSTRALVDKGWSGVYVEPNPTILEKLESVASISNSDVLPVAVGVSCGTMPFYVTGDLVSSLDKNHVEKWEKSCGVVFDTIHVEVVDINALADRIGYHYDVLNLDVEGINWDIFQQFDWSKWKFNVVCIEYDNKLSEMKTVLESAGFRLVYISPENIVAVR
jgi:FkbM family methyltransferase